MKINPLPLRQYLDNLGSLVREVQGSVELTVTGATADSREIQPGGLFVAIPGSQDNGLRHVPAALAAGARVIVAAESCPLPAGVTLVTIRQPYAAAARLAETLYGHPARNLRLFGVTGTNGKTTCAYLLREILRAAGRRTGMIGTVEYDLGAGSPLEADRTTPPPFLLQELLAKMVANRVQDVVMEISSHALDQNRPGTCRFAGALFTNLTGDHTDYHKNMDNYFAAKKRLFTEYLAPDAPAVINIDDHYGLQLAQDLQAADTPVRTVSFGRSELARARLLDVACSVQNLKITVEFSQRNHGSMDERRGITVRSEISLVSPLIGSFNAYNVGETVALAWHAGIAEAAIQEAVGRFTGAPGRLQAVKGSTGIMAFVDYAHTDDALKNVLVTLRQLRAPRLLVLFGCGGDRDRTKRPRMGWVAAELADRIYLTSDNPRSEEPDSIIEDIVKGIPDGRDFVKIPDRREAIRRAVAEARPGDLLLIAGKGHETYQEQNGVKTPFNDVEEVSLAMIAAEKRG